MRKIRTGIFETNSSSVHCICIANYGENDFTRNVLRCETDEFGWEYGMYSDVYCKADYLLTMIYCSERSDEYLEKLRTILSKHGIELDEKETSSYYIDHCGEWENTLEVLLNNEELLMSFLFNPKSYIETTNDNDDSVDELYEHAEQAERDGNTVFVKGN